MIFKPKTRIIYCNGLISQTLIEELILEIELHIEKEKKEVGEDLASYFDIRPIIKALSGN